MKRIIISVLIVWQALLLTSCLTTKETNLLQKPGGGVPSYPRVEVPVEEYSVKMGDQLLVMITFNPLDASTFRLFTYFSTMSGASGENERSFPVKPDGTIRFPYLGDIQVKGKTTLEIQQLIKDRIDASISDDCIVKVSLENRYFSVIGESSQSRYPIAKEQLTIYQALAQCRDILPYGDRKHIKIVRQTDEGTLIKTFDIRSQSVINSEFYYIQPNDVIYIQPLGRKFLGIDSFGAVFAITSSIITLGLTIYHLVKQ